MKAPIKHMVFDWNGTLLDDAHLVFESTNAVFKHLNRSPIDRATFDAEHVIPPDDFYRSLGVTESEIDRLHKERDVFHNHYASYETGVQLREGAVEILSFVHAAKFEPLILSNYITDPIKNLLRQHAIEHYFTEVLANTDHTTQFKGLSKGERLKRYFVENEHEDVTGVIVGDTVEEVHIGRELGLISVAITGGMASEKRLCAANPDYLIHSLHEIKPILQERGLIS